MLRFPHADVRRLASVRRAAFALFVLVLSACSSGGGCTGCGGGAIPGGFPRPAVIPNSAAIRLTKSGLDQLGALSPKVLSTILNTDGTISFNVPETKLTEYLIGSAGSTVNLYIDIDICPGGADTGVTPPTCVVNVDVKNANLHVDGVTAHSISLSGTIPLRLQDLPLSIDGKYGYDILGNSGGGTIVTANSLAIGVGQAASGGKTCVENAAGTNEIPNFDYFAFPITATIPIVDETQAPRDSYAKIDFAAASIVPTLTASNIGICGSCPLDSVNPLCSVGPVNTDFGCNCNNSHLCCNAVYNFAEQSLFSTLTSSLTGAISGLLASQACTKTDKTMTPSCPTGSHDNAGTCMFDAGPANTCVPIELGIASKIDLSSALASISPGTTGALDITLAGAGDLQVTAPDGGAGLPADNTPYTGHTPNGVTLAMLGGALPDPQSSCVPAFTNVPPTGIPIPDEMLKDTQTGWPTADPLKGPNFGLSLSGRFLNYAFGSIYNSGLLCLGITTDQLQQLQTGLLSVLIPSIKTLTFEQKAASVAITTRPQVPPKVTLGGGTDVNKDPLIKIELDKFAVDFYVWSDDRYVRAFTFTGDLTRAHQFVDRQRSRPPIPTADCFRCSAPSPSPIQVVTNSQSALADDPNGHRGARSRRSWAVSAVSSWVRSSRSISTPQRSRSASISRFRRRAFASSRKAPTTSSEFSRIFRTSLLRRSSLKHRFKSPTRSFIRKR